MARALRACSARFAVVMASVLAPAVSFAQAPPGADSVGNEPAARPAPAPPPSIEVDTTSAGTYDGRVGARAAPTRAVPAAERADTMQVLPFGAQLWVEVGAGGSVDPPEVKRYFGAGYAGALTMRWEPRSRLAALVHAGFQSLPRTEIVVISGGAQAVSFRLGGNASTYSVMAGPSARLWRRLWLETGAGFSHFAVGPGEESIGPLTEPPTMTRVRNTHGVAVRAGLAWRFPITDVRSMSFAAGWESMRAGASGEWLQQASARLGYRFY